MKPIIAVNTRLLLKGKLEGIGRVSFEILKRITALLPQAEFHFIFDRPYDPAFIFQPNVIPHVIAPPARHPFLYIAWFEYALPYLFQKIKPDIFYSPDAYLSLRTKKIPQIPHFHDLAFEHYPQGIDKLHAWHYKKYFPQYARKAAHILSVSAATQSDLIQTYNIPIGKITVVYNGVSDCFINPSKLINSQTAVEWTGGNPYFLYVGATHPRKNVDKLLLAFDEFKHQTQNNYKLLIVGRMAWKTQGIQNIFQQLKYQQDVIFTGYLADEQIASLYAGAQALVYISEYEGFGLPVIEAFASQTLVITSNKSSMKEIAGNAALLVNPHNINEIKEAMRFAANQAEHKAEIEQLQQQAKNRLALFNWDNTAQTVSEVLLRYKL